MTAPGMARPRKRAPSPVPADADTDRVRVLLVEPDLTDALTIRQLLRAGAGEGGISVADADSLAEACRMLGEQAYDVVISALDLPDTQGLELGERLLACGGDAAVVVLTSRYDERLGERAVRLGAHDYVPKNAMTGTGLRRVVRYARARSESRRAAEQRWRAEQRFTDSIIDSLPGVFTLIDDQGHVVRRNASLAIALKGDASTTGDVHYLDRVWPEDRGMVQEKLTEAFRTGGGMVELRLRRQDGTPMPIMVSTRLIQRDGRPCLLVSGLDLTERRAMEEQLVHAQKMESVGRLAGAVAHDFNNTLAAVMSFAELVLLDSPPDDPRRDDVQTILDAATRAASLTRQLLAFSRRQTFTPRVLDLNGVVAGLDRLLRRLIGEDIELVTILGDNVGMVELDAGQFESAVVNLAVNARDAMPAGGTLTVQTAREGGRVVLRVADTGTGMTPEVLRQAFDPFFTTKEPGKGTGLGLASVRGIVKQSGGNITVSSTPGVGTTFRIELLPLTGAAALPALDASGCACRGTETILLAEDNDLVRKAVQLTLTARGYTVLSAFSGEEAARIAEVHDGPIHLVLSDVIMPRMAAPEMLARLRHSRPGINVLLMSGYVSDAVQAELGTHAFIQKPFTSDAIAVKVREVLDARGGGGAPASP